MIEATIKIGDDGYDWFNGPCSMPAIPPIGGHITVIDKNANHQVLRVEDVVVGAVSNRMLDELPNMSQGLLSITILCSEAFGHPMQLRDS